MGCKKSSPLAPLTCIKRFHLFLPFKPDHLIADRQLCTKNAWSNLPSSLFCLFSQRFQQEAHRSESVIAGDHGRFRIFHPTVVKVFSTVSQSHDKGGHGIPCTAAESFRPLPAVTKECLAKLHRAGILNRIFILCDQIVVLRDLHYCDADFFHVPAHNPLIWLNYVIVYTE